ncbi:MAG TPA: hypothetical protein VIF60_11650 [Burkholderiaceae bacterium]
MNGNKQARTATPAPREPSQTAAAVERGEGAFVDRRESTVALHQLVASAQSGPHAVAQRQTAERVNQGPRMDAFRAQIAPMQRQQDNAERSSGGARAGRQAVHQPPVPAAQLAGGQSGNAVRNRRTEEQSLAIQTAQCMPLTKNGAPAYGATSRRASGGVIQRAGATVDFTAIGMPAMAAVATDRVAPGFGGVGFPAPANAIAGGYQVKAGAVQPGLANGDFINPTQFDGPHPTPTGEFVNAFNPNYQGVISAPVAAGGALGIPAGHKIEIPKLNAGNTNLASPLGAQYHRPFEVSATSSVVRGKGRSNKGGIETDIGHMGVDEALIRANAFEAYQGGHLVGDQLMDSFRSFLLYEPWNLAPQIAAFNTPQYQGNIEAPATQAIAGGATLSYKVNVQYPDNTYQETPLAMAARANLWQANIANVKVHKPAVGGAGWATYNKPGPFSYDAIVNDVNTVGGGLANPAANFVRRTPGYWRTEVKDVTAAGPLNNLAGNITNSVAVAGKAGIGEFDSKLLQTGADNAGALAAGVPGQAGAAGAGGVDALDYLGNGAMAYPPAFGVANGGVAVALAGVNNALPAQMLAGIQLRNIAAAGAGGVAGWNNLLNHPQGPALVAAVAGDATVVAAAGGLVAVNAALIFSAAFGAAQTVAIAAVGVMAVAAAANVAALVAAVPAAVQANVMNAAIIGAATAGGGAAVVNTAIEAAIAGVPGGAGWLALIPGAAAGVPDDLTALAGIAAIAGLMPAAAGANERFRFAVETAAAGGALANLPRAVGAKTALPGGTGHLAFTARQITF